MAVESGLAPSEGLRVAVRVRPLCQREEKLGAESILSTDEENGYLVLGRDRKFHFHNVFGVSASQMEVYQNCAAHLLDGCFDGMNATILAYGQTGSGKTHTMGLSGDRTDGIIPLIIRDLFDRIDKENNNVHLQCQFVDVYNEMLKDLISKDSNMKVAIHATHKGDDILSGARQVTVRDYSSTMNLLREGLTSRTTGATQMNAASSRSHAIFTITMKMEVKNTDDSGMVREVRSSKLCLVDLAGSEGLRTSGAVGTAFRELGHINRGLLSLGNVIAALSDDKAKGHVPYRGSKLTRILKDSLGGNSRTVFLACVTCASTSYEETLGTLNYASRAAKIKNKPVVNREGLQTENKIRDLTSRLNLLTKRQHATLQAVVDLESENKISPEVRSRLLESLFPGKRITGPVYTDMSNTPEASSSCCPDDTTVWGADEVSVAPSQAYSEETLPVDPTTAFSDDQSISEGNERVPSDHDLMDFSPFEEQPEQLNAEATATENVLDGPINISSPATPARVDERNLDLGGFDAGERNPEGAGQLVEQSVQHNDLCALIELAWSGAHTRRCCT